MLKKLNIFKWKFNKIQRYYIPKAKYKVKKEIDHNYDDKQKLDKINFRSIIPSLITSTLGYASLNNSQNYNILNEKLINEIIKQFEHYDLNNTLKCFIFSSQDKEIFSWGTDYKRIFYLLKENNIDQVKNYFDKISNLSEYLASYNKPHISYVSGLVKNSSLNLFTLNPFTFSDENATFQVNDIDFGFIPHGGNLHFLSRTDYEIGLFMALTGISASAGDMLKLNKIKDIKSYNKNDFNTLKTYSNRVLPFDKYGVDSTIDNDRKNIEKTLEKRLADEFYFRTFDQSTKENMSLVLKELLYKRKIINHANHFNNYDWEKSNQEYINQDEIKLIENNLFSFEKEVIDTYLDKDASNLKLKLYTLKDKISFHFCHNNIGDIYKSLENENSEWSLGILSILESKNQELLRLTIDSIRNSINLDYISCLKLETSINKNLIENKEILKILDNKINKKTNKINLSLNDIDFYKNGMKNENNLKFKEFSLLPVKEYYKEFAESVRLFLNEQGTYNIDIIENYEKMVKKVLFKYGIDVHNEAFDLNIIKKSLFNAKQLKRLGENRIFRIDELLNDNNKLDHYKQSRLEEIENMKDEYLFGLTEKLIEEIFDNNIINRNKDLEENSQILNKYLKNKEFDKIKKFLIKERMTYTPNELNNISNYNKPYSINSNILKLSDKEKNNLYFKEINNNFNLKKNYTIEDLKDYLSGELKFDDGFDLEAKNNDELIIDKNKINTEEKYNEDLIFIKKKLQYIIVNKQVKIEENFKNKFTNDLVGILIENNKIKANQKKQVFDEIYNELFSSPETYFEKSQDLKILNQLKTCLKKVNKTNLNMVNKNDSNEIKKINLSVKEFYDHIDPYINIQNNKNINDTDNSKDEISDLFYQDLIKIEYETVKDNIGFYWNRFNEYINYNESINSKLKDILNFDNPLAKDLKKILFSLFYLNIKKFNLDNIYNLGDKDDELLNNLNQYISNNWENDYFNYISSSIFYNFSVLGIKFLEKKFKNTNKNNNNHNVDIKKLCKNNNIVKDINNFESELKKIDDMFYNLIEIYNNYKDKTIFKEDDLFKHLNDYNNLFYSQIEHNENNKNISSIYYYLLSLNNVKKEYENKFYDLNNNLKDYNKDKNNLLEKNQAQNIPFNPKQLEEDFKKINENSSLNNIVKQYKNNLNIRFLEEGCFQSVYDLNNIMKQIKESSLTNLDLYYENLSQLDLNIPKNFDKLDFRQAPMAWLETTLKNILNKYFEERKKVERKLDLDTLIDYDNNLAELLKPEILRNHLKNELYNEIVLISTEEKMKNIQIIDYNDKVNQIDLIQNIAKPFLKNVKNEESLKKLLSLKISSSLDQENFTPKEVNAINKAHMRLLAETQVPKEKLKYEPNNELINYIKNKDKVKEDVINDNNEFFDWNSNRYNKLFFETLVNEEKKHFSVGDDFKKELKNYYELFNK